MGIATNEYLRIEIENLIKEAYALLPEIIEATRPSDLRAKSQNAKWWDRHKLHVLLDIAEETKQKLSRNIVVAPWFLAELKATIEITKRWKDYPKWKDVEPSLKNKDHFTHTIGKLRIAEHFMKSDHKAEIVPRTKDASPDLRIQAIGGTQDWLYVECYQPNALAGEPKEIPGNVLDKIVDRSMAKAKRQFKKRHPGIMAVLAYNQSKTNFERLIRRITVRLDRTDRPYLAGFLLSNQGVLFRRSPEKISFAPILSVEFISNPSYFGRIDIVSESTKTNTVYESIKTDELLGERIDALSKRNARQFPKRLPRKIKEIGLHVIKEPEPLSRTIIRSQEGKIFPFFKGTGNMNYLCGSCHAVLAEHTWKLSVSNIVVLCPSCQSYSEFPKIPELKYPVKGTIAIEKGNYDFSRWVYLKQGVTIFGV